MSQCFLENCGLIGFFLANMAARRLAASAVDWAAFAERVHPYQMESYRAFKAKSDAFIAKYVTCSVIRVTRNI